MEELRFMFKHLERKSNELIFSKCCNPRCDYCQERPIVAKEAWNYLQERDFKWANPMPSTESPGHYMTFLEVSKIDKDFIVTGKFEFWLMFFTYLSAQNLRDVFVKYNRKDFLKAGFLLRHKKPCANLLFHIDVSKGRKKKKVAQII